MNATDMREFLGYLRNCTNSQVQGVYDKEYDANRFDYATLAIVEANRRGIEIETRR